MAGFLGVDLTSSERKPTAYALLSEDLEIEALSTFHQDEEFFSLVRNYGPVIIGIDAPLGLPLGWHCLKDPCNCGQCFGPTVNLRRACEVELLRLKISFYWTTRKTFIKEMIYRAIAMRRNLESEGNSVVEVYPYATKVRLWGKQIPKKNTPAGILFLKQKLELLLPNLGQHRSDLDHDRADALLAAYTAWLHHRGHTEALGIAAEGQIVIPREGLAPSLRADVVVAP